MNRAQIAIQLYTVRDRTAQDFPQTLRELARMGYHAVEFAGYGGVSVIDLRAALEECDLRAIGAHVPFADLQTRTDEALTEARALGAQYVAVPSVPETHRGDVEDLRRLAGMLNNWGELCRAQGLSLAYHNHAYEFAPLESGNGRTMFDALVESTDPQLVGLELDIYWAAYAGVEPIGLLERYGARTSLVHIKDMALDAERSDAPVGEGTLPWDVILPAAARAGVLHYIVEQDNPGDSLEDARRSLRNLERF